MIAQCPKCHKKYDLDRTHLAKGSIKVRCPSCKNAWVIKAEFAKVEKKPDKKETKKEQDRRSAAPQLPKLLPIEDLITLRAIVGFLGEKKQFGWWDTNFLNPTGLQFLSINFPRTAFAAGCNSVFEAAKRLHDDRIGKRDVYHLFRLPTSVEEKLHQHLLKIDPDQFSYLKSKETALENLKGIISNTVVAPGGPVQIGTFKDMLKVSSCQDLAVHYYGAFQNQKMCFPYFNIY
jgi:predicted Zn finger-like uncharacterized protein